MRGTFRRLFAPEASPPGGVRPYWQRVRQVILGIRPCRPPLTSRASRSSLAGR